MTASGGIKLGASDLHFSGSDPGDIVWFNGSGAETERLWSQNGGGSLNYRTNAGTTYSLVHTGNISSQNVSYANSAGSVAWGNVTGKPFNWSGQSGQPTWLWGSNDGSNYYVWNPSNFSVNYASRAAYLDGHGVNPNNSHPGYGARVFYSWNTGQAGNADSGYSNGITIGSHPNDQSYGFQIVQNMWDDNTYTRRYNGGWQDWKTLLNNTNYPSYIDGRYLRYEGWWNSGSGQNVNDSFGMNFTYTDHGAPRHWGTTVTFSYTRDSEYRLQLHGTGDNYLFFRNRSADYGGWHSSGWKQVLTNQDTYVASDGTNRGIINGVEAASARHLLINGVTWNSDWYWSGQGGQPSWLWGSNDGVNMYVWNPSNFSVNYANSAGSVAWSNVSGRPTDLSSFSNGPGYITSGGSCSYASSSNASVYNTVTEVSNCNSANGENILKYYRMQAGASNLFTANSNANGLLWVGTHGGSYGHQIGFSSNGNLYHRNNNGSWWSSWCQMLEYVEGASTNINDLYDTGIYPLRPGSNCPDGVNYGVVLVMSYRKASGNSSPDFAVQIYISNGDAGSNAGMYWRMGMSTSWASWHRVS